MPKRASAGCTHWCVRGGIGPTCLRGSVLHSSVATSSPSLACLGFVSTCVPRTQFPLSTGLLRVPSGAKAPHHKVVLDGATEVAPIQSWLYAARLKVVPFRNGGIL